LRRNGRDQAVASLRSPETVEDYVCGGGAALIPGLGRRRLHTEYHFRVQLGSSLFFINTRYRELRALQVRLVIESRWWQLASGCQRW
jgi:hypothetical protein